MHSSYSYVPTSIIMSQHSFSSASSGWCRDPSFHVATAFLFRLCCNTILYYLHFCRGPESLSRQRLVVTEFDFLLQLCSDVALDFFELSIVAVVTQFSCLNKTLLCSAYLCYRDQVCYVATSFIFVKLISVLRH